MKTSLEKKCKKNSALLCFLVLLIVSVTFSICAYGEYDDNSVATSGYCGDSMSDNVENLKWYFENGTLTISGVGAMQDYGFNYSSQYWKPPWYSFRDSIQSVLIENGVKNISDSSFSNLYNLETVIIPDSVQAIGQAAFLNCLSLKSVELSDSVMYIGDYSFANCANLQNVVLSNNLEVIYKYSFAGCSELKSISIPDSVQGIAWGAFYGCNGLEAVQIGRGIEGSKSESYLDNLLVRADYYGFLEGLLDSEKLKCITVDDNSANLKSVDGVLFDASGEILIRYPQQKQGSTYSIPEGVKIIFRSAFENCSNLENIEFPESLEYIYERAFCGCSSIKEIAVPNGVSFISSNSIDAMGKNGKDRTFKDCMNLQTAVVPELAENIFEGCKNLRIVTITESKSEEEWQWPSRAFLNCFSLEKIYFKNNPEETILFPEALQDLGEAFIYGYDFIATEGLKHKINDTSEEKETEQRKSQCFVYYDDNPYSEIFCNYGTTMYLLHRDGSVSIASPHASTLMGSVEERVKTWSDIRQIVLGHGGSVAGLKKDGSLVFSAESDESEYELDPIKEMKNVDKIALLGNGWGTPYIIAHTTDGRVLSQCPWLSGQLAGWTDIVDLACYRSYGAVKDLHLSGVRRDGSICSINTSDTWLGITDHVASIQQVWDWDLIALNDDGTVIVTDGLAEIAYELSQWKDIIQIECDHTAAVGLRKDGTLISTGGCFPEATDWNSIKEFEYYGSALFAVDAEGSILEIGSDISHSEWKNVEKIYFFDFGGLVAITTDGHLISDFELYFFS